MAENLEQRIRERAHALWEKEGRPQGRDQDHWRQARREMEEGAPSEPQVAPAGRDPSDADVPVGESLEEIVRGEHQGP